MAARPISSTTISFGLVTLPVKVYSTGETSRKVSFNMIHEECGTRLKRPYVCPTCERPVSRDEIVKGYEFAKDQYVVFTSDELEAIETPRTEGIDITEFVPEAEVDRIYFDRAYYLGPDKGGTRAYRLLSAALERTGRVAIAKYVTRGKAYLVMVRPLEAGLVMEQLRYADEVRSFEEVPVENGEVEVKDDELKLAVQLIEQSSNDAFEPEKYEDEVREQMLAMIQQKVEGEEITAVAAEEAEPQIIDLMSALKASLSEAEEAAERKPAEKASGKKKKSKKKAASS